MQELVVQFKRTVPQRRGDLEAAVKVIVIVDDRMGTEYNRRPLSRDRKLIRDLLFLTGPAPLYADARLLSLFPENDRHSVRVSDDPFADAGPGEYVLAGGRPLSDIQDQIEELILYRWNRHYPSDKRLDLDPDAWTLMQYASFAGSSHPRISREIYKKEGHDSFE